MRHTYPAARFLGIVASGDFTRPAMELIRSREIDLFYIPKAKVIEAFSEFKLEMDYPDKASEGTKSAIADAFCAALTPDIKLHVAESLRSLMTEAVVQGYADRVKANLSALPQEVRIMGQRRSAPAVFESVDEAEEFLAKSPLTFDFAAPTEAYTYEVTYSDGMEFSKLVGTLDELRDLNASIKRLADHMRSLIKA